MRPWRLVWLAPLLAAAIPVFDELPLSAGIDFVLRNSATPEKHQIETMAGGLAVLDFDGDGWMDIFFTNGAPQPSLKKDGPAWWNRLYRNRRNGKFEDVTARAGLQGEGFAIGAAAGDYDHDGHTDLLVTGVHRNTLYRNNGDGTFANVTAQAGIHNEPWSVAAGFLDYDNDGHLDLFIANYVTWDPAREPFCGDPKRTYRTYCHPKFYTGLPNTLYRNNGNGTFADVSRESGIAAHIGKGMGVAFADYNADGRLDILVANDTVPNFLFRNEGSGPQGAAAGTPATFTEVGLTAGVAFNDDGRALSSMGADFRDIDGDGQPDLFITALANETFPFYRNAAKGMFTDATYTSRVGAATILYSGWSNGIYDFDNDGRRDLFAANGDVNDNTETFSSGHSRQPCLLLRQAANGRFESTAVTPPALHRGAAFADFDNDGRVDIAVTRIGERAAILRNRMGDGAYWLGLRLIGKKSNRDAIGARVKAGSQWNHVTRSVGYASSSDPRVHFGLGAQSSVEVEIHWPSGAVQKLGSVKANQYFTVEEP